MAGVSYCSVKGGKCKERGLPTFLHLLIFILKACTKKSPELLRGIISLVEAKSLLSYVVYAFPYLRARHIAGSQCFCLDIRLRLARQGGLHGRCVVTFCHLLK